MLLKITNYEDLNERSLMDLYAEGNLENTDYFYPELTDRVEALRRVEANFLDFLKTEFYARDGSVYWILEEDGVWISALRTNCINPGLYYLEALETRADRRKQGYAARLLNAVTDALKQDGPFELCDCVDKENLASINTHQKCGFQIASEAGYDYLRDESDIHEYGFAYRYTGD